MSEQIVHMYSEEDFKILEGMLLKEYSKDKDSTLDVITILLKTAVRINEGTEDRPEFDIYTRSLTIQEKRAYKEYEPFGEPKYFVFISDRGILTFTFSKRHLKRLLLNDISDMPLLMNTEFVGVIATWRLKIGK